MPTLVNKPTAKEKFMIWLRKSWNKHTANLELTNFVYRGKRYKPQLMGFVCINDGTYYPMVPQSP